MKKLDVKLNKGRQDVTYEELLEYNGNKLMIIIKSDSFERQCYAIVKLFNNKKWNTLDSIHYSNMQTPAQMVYRDKTDEWFMQVFQNDVEELKRLAKLILS